MRPCPFPYSRRLPPRPRSTRPSPPGSSGNTRPAAESSPPPVVGDLVFVGACNGVLHAVDRRTGKARWTFDAKNDGGKPEFHGRPLVTAKTLVVASDDRRREGVAYVYAFDRSTFAPLWKYRAGPGVMTDILESQGTLFFVTLDDELTALDLATGSVRWKFTTGALDDNFVPNSTPALAGERVLFGGRDGSVCSLDARSGAVAWRGTLGARISTSIVVLGNGVYVGDEAGRIHRLDIATGKVEAELQIDGSPTSVMVPADSALLVFSHDDDGVITLQSIPVSLAKAGWTQGADPPGWTSFARPYVWNGTVVVGRETGDFAGLRLSDGRPAWSGKVSGRIAGIGGDQSWLYLGTTR